MFIDATRSAGGYTRDGRQWGRGPYLLLFSGSGLSVIDDDSSMPDEARARVHCAEHGKDYPAVFGIVRHVRLSQLGHWMLGSARIADARVTVSGAYGSDGLPGDLVKLTARARSRLTRLPDDLTRELWHGGGHNSAGIEAPSIRAWARAIGRGEKINGNV